MLATHESGRDFTRAQGAAAELAGADAILIGSALMRADDPAARLHEILSRPLVKVCGLTRRDDVDAAVEAGADMLGFILAGMVAGPHALGWVEKVETVEALGRKPDKAWLQQVVETVESRLRELAE